LRKTSISQLRTVQYCAHPSIRKSIKMRSALRFANSTVRRQQQQRASAKHQYKLYRQQHSKQQPWSVPSADRVALWAVAAALSIQLLDAALQPTYDARDSTTAQSARDDAVRLSFHFVFG